MKIDAEKIRAHAEQRIGSAADPTDRIVAFRRFLGLELRRLRMRHRFGLGGMDVAFGRSLVVDTVVAHAWETIRAALGPTGAREVSGCALVAVGGYGRRELAPASDVDLLLLHPYRITPAMRELAERILPLLWDIGLEVGSSFRSVAACVAMGLDDLHSRNAMTDARLLVGSEPLFQEFDVQMDISVYGNHMASRDHLRRVMAEVHDREQRYGDVVCMQEPHLKEGAGGLRDLHVMRWVGRTRWGTRTLDGLVDAGAVRRGDLRRALRAYHFLMRIRNEAHFQTGRQTDQLALELQPALARALHYEPERGMEASELFMREYYRRSQELRRVSQTFLLESGLLDRGRPGFLDRLKARSVGPGGRWEIRRGRLHSRVRDRLGERAERLLEAFEVAQTEGIPVSDDLLHEVHENLGLVDRKARASPEMSRRFLAILGRTGRVGATLRAMRESGLLGRYLPEFGRVSLLIQHDHYHRYTVDEHTLRAVDELDHVSGAAEGGDSVLVEALREVEDPRRLYLAVLLHDVGKGRGGEHVRHGARISRRIAERLRLDEAASDDVAFLVQKHLVMSQVSQRRDISDPSVIAGFAETVSTRDRLNMLFLLTRVDTAAVGPGVWTEWKASLLGELYARTRARLERPGGSPTVAHGRVRIEDRVLADLLPAYLRSDVDEFVSRLPDRYLRAVAPELIAQHFTMARTLGDRILLTDWRPTPDGRHLHLSVCLRDRPGVLSRMAGTLTAKGFDILSLNAFTSTDGIVLDLFRLSEPFPTSEGPGLDDSRKAEVGAALSGALDGRYDVELGVRKRMERQPLEPARAPSTAPRVRFDPPDESGRTVVEVRADNEPGLVYRITAALSQLGLDISFAKVATEKNQALDVFYVSRSTGVALEPSELSAVEAALTGAIRSGRTSSHGAP